MPLSGLLFPLRRPYKSSEGSKNYCPRGFLGVAESPRVWEMMQNAHTRNPTTREEKSAKLKRIFKVTLTQRSTLDLTEKNVVLAESSAPYTAVCQTPCRGAAPRSRS